MELFKTKDVVIEKLEKLVSDQIDRVNDPEAFKDPAAYEVAVNELKELNDILARAKEANSKTVEAKTNQLSSYFLLIGKGIEFGSAILIANFKRNSMDIWMKDIMTYEETGTIRTSVGRSFLNLALKMF